MSRTTGFTAAVVARRILAGDAPSAGVHPPEDLADRADLILADLAELGIDYRFSKVGT